MGQSLKIFASVPVEAAKSNTEPLVQAAAPKEVKKEEVKKEEPKAVERKVEQPKELNPSTSPEVKEIGATSTS